MPNPPATMAPATESWAEVRAHDHVMRYRRSGTGGAVLVLRASGAPDPLWPELADTLASRFRVIAPEVPASGVDVAAWLTTFLEGLGCAGVAVVAADQFCMPALELALLDRDRVARVVLVPWGASEETGLDGVLGTTAREGSVPLLVVRRGLAAAEALPLVTSFLGGNGAHPPG